MFDICSEKLQESLYEQEVAGGGWGDVGPEVLANVSGREFGLEVTHPDFISEPKN